MSFNSDSLICVAAIAGAFGVKGEIKLKSFTEQPEDCLAYGPLLDEEGQIALSVTSSRLQKGFVVVRAQEVTTREQAQALKSTKLYIPRTSLPEPDEDEFYYSDLVGLGVKSTDGKRIGKVVAVHEFGAGDMLEIKPEDTPSFFHPFTKEAVPKVDMVARRVIIQTQEEAD